MKRAALYLRVSTKEQTTENQRLELERIAAAKGWRVSEVYEDYGLSGTKGRDKRPAYDRLLKDAVRSRFDVVMVWDVSRLGRSLSGLIEALEDLQANGVDLYLHQQALDTTTPSGKALYQMCGVFAEFERGMISERVRAGLERSRAEGKVLGRPLVQIDTLQLVQQRAQGLSIRKLAGLHGVSVGKIHQALRKAGRLTE